MKVIFLDIDGVLNNATYARTFENPNWIRDARGWDPESVLLLQRLIEATDARVVVSSTWRIWWDDCLKYLGMIGITPIGKTQVTGKDTLRGNDIANWLVEAAIGDQPLQIEKYVILDDDSDMLPHQADNFVQTTWEHGFKLEHFERALAILGGN